MKVEVFVRKEEVATGHTIIGRPMSDGVTTHYCTTQSSIKTEKILTEESKKVLDEATKRAKELNATVVVYNLSTVKGRLTALMKGVKSPTWRIAQ